MAKIYIKGIKEPIEIERMNAMAIKHKFDDQSVQSDYTFALANMSFKKGDIKIIIMEERDNTALNVNRESSEAEFERGRRQRQAMLPSIRAREQKGYIGLLWRCMGNPGEIPDITFKQIVGISEKFFTQNPKRIFVPVSLLIDILPKGPKFKTSHISRAGFDLFERVMSRDALLADIE